MFMLSFIAQGAGFGFSAGITPGPLQMYLFSTALTLGWRRSLPILSAPLIADAPIILVCTFLLQELDARIVEAIRIFGGLFVLYLAWGTFNMVRRQAAEKTKATAETTTVSGSPLPKAVMLIYLSPGPYIFWMSINGPLLRDALNQSIWHALAFLLGFYGVFLGIMGIQMRAFAHMSGLNPKITQRLLLLSAGIMALLGLSLVWQGISTLFLTPQG
jgi:threonine/homoserine/homoserine lactone efflux protein